MKWEPIDTSLMRRWRWTFNQKILPTLRLRHERKTGHIKQIWEEKGTLLSGVSHQLKLKNYSTITKFTVNTTYVETKFLL